MKITIGHLYYDILNLYGENGNVLALEKYLTDQKIKVTIKKLSIGDNINFDKLDIIYIGSGTLTNLLVCLKDIYQYKINIMKNIEANKLFLATGNSYNLFGEHIETLDKKKHNALGIYDYHAKEEEIRIMEEATFKYSYISNPVFGFQNHNLITLKNNNPMFEVIKGVGSYKGSTGEGINYKNFYGTYLVGPLLIRNPEFTEYVLNKYLRSQFPKIMIKSYRNKTDKKAYQKYYNEIK